MPTLDIKQLRKYLESVSDEDFEKFLNGYALGSIVEKLFKEVPSAGRAGLLKELQLHVPSEAFFPPGN